MFNKKTNNDFNTFINIHFTQHIFERLYIGKPSYLFLSSCSWPINNTYETQAQMFGCEFAIIVSRSPFLINTSLLIHHGHIPSPAKAHNTNSIVDGDEVDNYSISGKFISSNYQFGFKE